MAHSDPSICECSTKICYCGINTCDDLICGEKQTSILRKPLQTSVILSMQDNLEKIIKCPLSECIFSDPVIGPDGNTYERKAIQYFLVNESKKTYNNNNNQDNTEEILFESPITGELIPGNLISNTYIKNLVSIILQSSPELTKNQFYNSKPYYLFDKEFKELLCEDKYEKLKIYFKIKLNDVIEGKDKYVFQRLICCPDNELIKELLRNSEDYNIMTQIKAPIHDAAVFSNPEIIRFMVKELNVDMTHQDIFKNLPVHYICGHQKITEEIYDIVTDETWSNEMNSEGLCPIHIIAKYNNNWENFAPFIMACNICCFNIPSKEGKYAIHYICEFAKFETIKNVIDLDIDLDVECLGKVKENAADDFIRLNEKLTREEKRDLTLQYLSKRVVIKKLREEKEAEIKAEILAREATERIIKMERELEEAKRIILKENDTIEQIIDETKEIDSDGDSDTCSEISSEGEQLEIEIETNFADDHFDITHITEDSSGSDNSRIVEITTSSGSHINGIRVYEDYAN